MLVNKMELCKYYNLSISKRALKYQLYLPNNNLPKRLLIFLHGAGERGSDGKKHIEKNVAILENIINHPKYKDDTIIIAPQVPLKLWWYSQNNYKFNLLVNDFITKGIFALYNFDKKRVHGIGLSMGAMGLNNYIINNPNLFNSAISICGLIDLNYLNRFNHTKVWLFHSSDDNVVDYSSYKEAYPLLKDINNDTKFTLYNNVGHNSWDSAYREPNIIEWLFD